MPEVLDQLRQQSRDELADELEALLSTLGEDAVEVQQQEGLRLVARTTLPPPKDDVPIKMALHVPQGYPSTHPPAIGLPPTTRYIGPFGIDDADALHSRLGSVIGEDQDAAVPWTPGELVLWAAIEAGREEVGHWYAVRADDKAVKDLERKDERAPAAPEEHLPPQHHAEPVPVPRLSLPVGTEVFSSAAIVDRKSVFVGHAARLNDLSEVEAILAHLLADRKIARATHNIVAWRCRVNGVLHQDNDDDGETAAGSRMAHLLEILGVENVFVCVTRWYGGIQLGADRFKHINQATRDCLQLGGFLPTEKQPPKPARRR